eukprot:GDKJ01028868.1.p1 GENE.GDKJ01028868.1~~GDKJ01028868.1.p1  ORF type:complete len:464 (+),score=99.52 GDKJ01028868.1:21-1412(+)
MSDCILYDIPADLEARNLLFLELGQKVRDGGLVALPTETVYGLGANALDTRAVLSIFTTKGRPLTDPVICHVADAESGLQYIDLPDQLKAVYNRLTEKFWPGPLSLVGKARACIPSVVTANTGSVAVRCPNNEIALSLIRAAGVPIAAPSANKFGCISPTTWRHVAKAFSEDKLSILKGPPCLVGIESTVAKLTLVMGENSNLIPEIIVLRVGAVTIPMMQACLNGLVKAEHIRLSEKISSLRAVSNKEAEESLKAVADAHKAVHDQASLVLQQLDGQSENNDVVIEETGEEAPGMLLTHYAPSVPTYLIQFVDQSQVQCSASTPIPTKEALLVDVFETDHSTLTPQFQSHFFKSISPSTHSLQSEDVSEEDKYYLSSFPLPNDSTLSLIPSQTLDAARLLFATMHAADDVAKETGCKAIYLVAPQWNGGDGLDRAILDRLYRASSGRLFKVPAGQTGEQLWE